MTAGIAIDIDGERVVTVATEGLEMLDVRLHGDIISEEFATLDVTGSSFGEDGAHKFLIWIGDRLVAPKTEVEVTLLDGAETSLPGKSIDEMYPAGEQEDKSWEPTEAIYAELAARPHTRAGFGFALVAPGAPVITSRTAPGDHSFAFVVSWTKFHPEIARVSLSSNSLESIRTRTGGTKHAELRMGLNDKVTIRVDG